MKDKIIEFIKKAKGKIGNKGYLDFGIVSNKEAEQIKKIININVEGYKRTLDDTGINHVFKIHKDIKDEDFLLIPSIIKEYDFIGAGKKPDTIVYKKLIVNDFFYIETVRKGRKKLAIKTFYKKNAQAKSKSVKKSSSAFMA